MGSLRPSGASLPKDRGRSGLPGSQKRHRRDNLKLTQSFNYDPLTRCSITRSIRL